MLNREAGSDGDDVLGGEGDICAQSGWERVHMVDEYNNNSRNFANENKLGKERSAIVRPRSSQEVQLTKCHQTFYIVRLTLDRFYNSATFQYLPNARRAMQKGPALPSTPPRESRRGSIFARVVVGETCNPAVRMVRQPARR